MTSSSSSPITTSLQAISRSVLWVRILRRSLLRLLELLRVHTSHTHTHHSGGESRVESTLSWRTLLHALVLLASTICLLILLLHGHIVVRHLRHLHAVVPLTLPAKRHTHHRRVLLLTTKGLLLHLRHMHWVDVALHRSRHGLSESRGLGQSRRLAGCSSDRQRGGGHLARLLGTAMRGSRGPKAGRCLTSSSTSATTLSNLSSTVLVA